MDRKNTLNERVSQKKIREGKEKKDRKTLSVSLKMDKGKWLAQQTETEVEHSRGG